MEVEIKKSEKKKIVYDGKAFEISKPKVLFLRDFNKRMKAASSGEGDEGEVELMYAFCLEVGVPEDILKSWDMDEMIQLFDAMNSEKKTST